MLGSIRSIGENQSTDCKLIKRVRSHGGRTYAEGMPAIGLEQLPAKCLGDAGQPPPTGLEFLWEVKT